MQLLEKKGCQYRKHKRGSVFLKNKAQPQNTLQEKYNQSSNMRRRPLLHLQPFVYTTCERHSLSRLTKEFLSTVMSKLTVP